MVEGRESVAGLEEGVARAETWTVEVESSGKLPKCVLKEQHR